MDHFPVSEAWLYPPGSQWYAVYCNPLRERHAAAALHDYLEVGVYLPEIKRRLPSGNPQQAPLFPRYIFVWADLTQVAISSINATPGVHHLVSIGDGPQPIPADVIEALRYRVDVLNSAGGLVEHGFHPGDPLRFHSGPLRGLEAVFIGSLKPSERVRVLVDFLGSLRETEVSIRHLERAGAVPHVPQQRRTRGGGRRIRGKG